MSDPISHKAGTSTAPASRRFDLVVPIAGVTLPYKRENNYKKKYTFLKNELASSGNDFQAAMETAERLLRFVNTVVMEVAERSSIADSLAIYCRQWTARWMEFARQENLNRLVYEEMEKRIADNARVMDALVNAYAVCYTSLSDGTHSYAEQAPSAYHCAFRVVELIHSKQLLLALVKKTLVTRDWSLANTVMFNQLCFEDTQRSVKASVLSSFYEIPAEKFVSFGALSLDFVYRTLQFAGLVREEGWPLKQLLFGDALLYRNERLMRVGLLRPDERIPSDVFVTTAEEQRPAGHPPETIQKPSICLETGELQDTLDRQRVLLETKLSTGVQGDGSLDLLNLVHEDRRLPMVHKILDALKPKSRQHKRMFVGGKTRLNIFFGFASIYQMLTYRQSGDSIDAEQLMMLEQLSKQSSHMISEEGYQTTYWNVMDMSYGGLMVQTPTTRYSLPLQQDDLVAFVPDGDETTPHIGFITRAEIQDDISLQAGIARISQSARAIQFRAYEERKDRAMRPALLLQGLENESLLLVEPREKIRPGDPLLLYRGSKAMPGRLGRVVYAKEQFTVYVVSSPQLSYLVTSADEASLAEPEAT